MPGPRPGPVGSSIRDVALRAGVSTATVSRALRGLDRVSPPTRDRVLHAAAELGYVASPTAATLASGRTGVVAVVVPFLQRWFFAALLGGTEERLRQSGYHVLLFAVGLRASHRTLILDQALLGKRVDAVLVLSADLEPEEVAVLDGLGVPVVSVGVELGRGDRVGIDDRAAARLALAHLLGLGHQRVALVGGTPAEDVHTATAVERRAAVLQGLSEAGLALPAELDLECDWTVEGGRRVGRGLLALPEPPTAVLAASDEMAVGVLLAARELGVAVPGALSVVGIDDHEMAVTHDLTTVAQPVREQGVAAAELVVAALQRPASPGGPDRRELLLPISLVVRGSTACPAGHGAHPGPAQRSGQDAGGKTEVSRAVSPGASRA